MYSNTVTANDEAFVDVRVCELQIQYGNLPSSLDSGFQIDGLYIVLRCGDEVRRTNCLWPSVLSSNTTAGTTAQRLVSAHEEGDEEGDWVWNELFRFQVPPAPLTVANDVASAASSLHGGQKPLSGSAAGNAEVSAPQSSGSASFTPPLMAGATQSSRDGLSNAVLPMSTAAAAAAAPAINTAAPTPTHPHSASGHPNFHNSLLQKSPTPAASTSPFLHPAIDIELWRSTPNAENCLARYTYHVPLELMHGGYGLQHLDAVAERVVPLRTKEAPSIMGNLYGWNGHRLSLLLRVQAVGLPPVTADWTLPANVAMGAGASTSNMYTLPYSVALSDPVGRSALLGNTNSNSSNSYGAGGFYSSPYNTLNPVLANLLAPLGVNTANSVGVLSSSPQGPLRPAAGVLGFGGTPGGVMQPVFPSANSGFYSGLSSSSSPLGSSRAGPVLPSSGGGGSSSGGGAAAPRGQGILGDGDPAWRGPVLPPVLPS